MNYSLDRLNRQKEELEALIKSYQGGIPNKNLIEWRILNENEEVDNLYVQNKTLFINDNMMVLKGVDGKLEKWEIKKIYPIDKKDAKQTLDLLVDAYKWKMMARNCDEEDMKSKYMQVSDTLYNMFMTEHTNIGNMFREE